MKIWLKYKHAHNAYASSGSAACLDDQKWYSWLEFTILLTRKQGWYHQGFVPMQQMHNRRASNGRLSFVKWILISRELFHNSNLSLVYWLEQVSQLLDLRDSKIFPSCAVAGGQVRKEQIKITLQAMASHSITWCRNNTMLHTVWSNVKCKILFVEV